MSFQEKILNQSKSYNYYKNQYVELNEININQKNEIKKLKNEIKSLKKELNDNNQFLKLIKECYNNLNVFARNSHVEILSSINEVYNLNKNLSNNNNLINKEINYALIFNDTIKDSNWLIKRNFSLNNGAANYSFMYVLYRILDEINPKNILEFGLGQTTKLTTQYVNFNKESSLITVENDQSWIDVFSKKLDVKGNINITYCDVELFEYNNSDNLRFKDLKKIISDLKFDLIIIDGPVGFSSENKLFKYSRSNIWELIPNNLADDFVIVIDDFERSGEKNTIEHVKELLKENNIEFYTFTSFGIKQQHIIVSDKYKFVSWF